MTTLAIPTTYPPAGWPKYGQRAGACASVIGCAYGGVVYLYDAPEYRRPYGDEVYERDGGYWYLRDGGSHMQSIDVTDMVAEAYSANRYWPGEEEMMQRELDATLDAMLAGTR